MSYSKVSIVVPSTFGENSPADCQLVADVTNRVMRYFCSSFGGSTLTPGQSGGWINDAGELISEGVATIHSYTDITPDIAFALVKVMAEYVRDEMQQSCVLVTIEPVTGFYLV